MSDNDAQLEIKKRARRRLVGAVALALAAAIILPMVMDKEPRSTANELQIRIPSQEGGNYTARLINSTASAPVAMAPLEPALPASEPVAAPVAASTPAAQLEKPPLAPTVKDVPKEAPAKEAPPKEAAPKEPDGAARAKSLLEGGDPVASENKRFYVQLGVYRDAENVKSLRAKIKTVGFSTVVEPVGESSRVRVGPFSDREAADKALAKLKKSGLSGMVVSAK